MVVGQRVHAALSGFKGKKVAVLIATQGFIDKLAPNRDGDEMEIDAAWVAQGYADVKGRDGAPANPLLINTATLGNHKITVAYATTGHPTLKDSENPENPKQVVMRANTSSGAQKPLTFVQYNALLESTDANGNSALGAAGGQTVIKYENGTYIFDGVFRTDGGKVVFDLDFANLSKTGMTEMVPGAARFHANLLKDANGVILGVVFQQVGN